VKMYDGKFWKSPAEKESPIISKVKDSEFGPPIQGVGKQRRAFKKVLSGRGCQKFKELPGQCSRGGDSNSLEWVRWGDSGGGSGGIQKRPTPRPR